MFGGKPVFVFMMYSLKARMRWDSVHIVASCPREDTSFSRRSRTLARAGQVRMACWKVSGPVSQRGKSGWGSRRTRRGGRQGSSSPIAFGEFSLPRTSSDP